MEEIRIDLEIEPGTPFSFTQDRNNYVENIRFVLSSIKDEIIQFGGYVTLRQRKDGFISVKTHCFDSKDVLNKMNELMTSILGASG